MTEEEIKQWELFKQAITEHFIQHRLSHGAYQSIALFGVIKLIPLN